MAEYDYDYPLNLDLRPESDLHQRIVNEVIQRALYSVEVLSSRFESWKKIDHQLTAYVPLKEEESVLKQHDPKKPVSIVVPFTFVVLDTIITYLSRAFLEDIYFPCEGVSPEDTLGAIKLQHVLQQQAVRGKLELALHTQWRDMLAYGTGYIVPIWTVKTNKNVNEGTLGLDALITGDFDLLNTVWEGHSFETIDPYLALPDPSVPIQKLQDMEFFGWVSSTNLMNLLRDEVVEGSPLFNCRYLKDDRRTSRVLSYINSGRNDRTKISTETKSLRQLTQVDLVTMLIKLIPKDWELGDGEVPELWEFCVANDHIVIKAQKIDLTHGQMPVVAAAPDFDGYSVSPLGRLEIIYGLQEFADWLISSHIVNIRKTLNNVFVVDPTKINIKDLMQPTAGKIIRTTYSTWGTNALNNAIMQLPVHDVTQNNIKDLMVIMELIQRASAAVDSLQGFLRPTSERRTATETRDTRMSALSRLMRIARVFSIMSMRTLGELMAEQTKQYMSMETWVKLVGKWEEILQKEYGMQEEIVNGRLRVLPQDINILYDINIKDSFVGNMEQGDLWIQLMQVGAQIQPIAQQLDFARMFLHAARLLGARNVTDFLIKSQGLPPPGAVSTMPVEQIEQEVQKGNMVPYGELAQQGTELVEGTGLF